MSSPSDLPTRRGHGPKIAEAVRALERDGALPPNLRPVQVRRLITDWLKANGYENDLPTKSSIDRFFHSQCNVGQSVQTVGAG